MRLIEKAKCLVFVFCFARGSRLSPPRITALWEPRGLCHGCRDRKWLWKHKHIMIKCEALSDPLFNEGTSSFPTGPAWQVHPTLYKDTPWTYKQKPKESKDPENMSRCGEYVDYSEGPLLSGSGVSPSLPKLPPQVAAFPSVTHLEAEAVPFCPKTSAPVALRLPLAFLSAFRLVPHPLQGGGGPGKQRGWIQK